VYLPTESYNAYVKATGAVPDSAASGLLAITEEQYAALKPLVFSIGSAGSYVLSPNAQIWPRSLNTDIGGNESAIYMIVANASVSRALGKPSRSHV
jgi:saccharopepsin